MQILGLSPHTDDVELGAGGSIVRWIEEGHKVTVKALSTGNPETGATRDEFRASMDALGVWENLGYPDLRVCRRFNEDRQEILDDLIDLERLLMPDLVLVPSRSNVHQDHEVVTAEAIRAFRYSSILGYEMPWGDVHGFSPQLFVKLKMAHLHVKLDAIDKYESQMPKVYTSRSVIESLSIIRGMQAGTYCAEAFEVIRWVM